MTRLLVAQLVHQFQRDGSRRLSVGQQRNPVAFGRLSYRGAIQAMTRKEGDHLADALVFALGKMPGCSEDVVVDGKGGTHGAGQGQ